MMMKYTQRGKDDKNDGTLCVHHSRTIVILWYDLRVFWLNIKCLKSALKSIFFHYPNKYRSDLSKKLVFDPVGPRATKLWALKVCSRRESNPGRPKSSNSLFKIAKNVASNPKCLEFFFDCQLWGSKVLQPFELRVWAIKSHLII